MTTTMNMRAGTTDMAVYKEIIGDNHYRLPEEFVGNETVLDVGAHIGIFARACAERGAKRIVCYEPVTENFEYLQKNTKEMENIEIHHEAMWGNDEPPGRRMKKHPLASQTANACLNHEEGEWVDLARFDDVARRLGEIDLLKLDCEGAEYSILFTSKELSRVKKIVGEGHCGPYGTGCPLPFLIGYLQSQGFKAEAFWMEQTPEQQGLFYAWRE